MPTRFTLIRHGETDWNVSGRWQGQAPVPLNDLGHRQARVTAAYLASNGTRFDAVYSSDLSRAAVTAQYIVERLGGVVVPDRRLREIDLGDWQGLTNEEVQAWDNERFLAVRKDTLNAVRPGGESWTQVGERAVSLLRELLTTHPNGDLLLVAHGGTIRSILFTLTLKDLPAAHIDNCSRTILGHQDGAWTLEAYNLTDHLQNVDAHHWQEDNFTRF
jgi:broad specificity phosphatase PhoE